MRLRQKSINSLEVHQYVEDLKSITLLRDTCSDREEVGRYIDIIEVMQSVLLRLNEN